MIRIVKLAAISFFVLFLVVTAISLLLPSQIIVSRAIDIQAPCTAVYNRVHDIGIWPTWMQDYDSSINKVSQQHTGVGAVLFSGNKKMTITQASAQQIAATWQVGKNKPLHGSFNFISNPNSAYCTLQWQFVQQVQWYPWQKFSLLLSEQALGPFMQQSLENLRRQVQSSE